VPGRAAPVQSGASRAPYRRAVSAQRPVRQPRLLAVIAVGGVLGSLARWGIDLAFGERDPGHWPWATLVVNVIGCLLIGVLASRLPTQDGAWWPRPLLITGVLGGFTTFSAYAVETGLLIDEGAPLAAAAYLAVTVLAGLLAVLIGQKLATGRTIEREGPAT
jgi:CrcB protein